MRVLTFILGVFFLFTVLLDAFQTIILPRRATGPVRFTRLFYQLTWTPWVYLFGRLPHPRRRETVFSFYGPLSLIFLLAFWAAGLLLGFGLIYYAIGSPFMDATQKVDFWTDLYVSGTTVFTLGLGDVTPHDTAARWLMIMEAGTGFGFLAAVMGYFPVLYSAFSRREVSISMLDARAGSPPTATELLRRHTQDGGNEWLSELLMEWERWSAELLESHISFPLLCYFRSQHTNQSWISALTAILDTSSLLIAGVRGHEARQAQLTFAMARHAMVDLTQVLSLEPVHGAEDRLPDGRYEQMYGMLCEGGVSMCRDGESVERLRELRRLYEPYAIALSLHFCMPLPPWIPPQGGKDNWLRVARVRSRAEGMTQQAGQELVAGRTSPSSDIPFHDEQHHEF